MLAIVNGKVIIGSRIENKVVLIDKDRILDVCSEIPDDAQIIDARGMYVSPGFLDVHIHGCAGRDMMMDSYESILKMSQCLLSTGVTAFLATTMTKGIDEIRQAIAGARKASFDASGAELLGIHLEGPFISQKYKGAHENKNIIKPSVESFMEICGDNEDFVKIVTLAPELEEADELIAYLNDRGIVSSIGHTEASYEEAKAGIEWGIKSSTHTFNGMRGFNHREPGALGAVLDSHIMAECIADGVHVHPGALRILAKQKGLDNIILVTDSMMAAGIGDGEYSLGGQKAVVKSGVARLNDGTLAGSTLTMNIAVKNMVSYLGITIPQAVTMATENPSRLLGLKNRGRIAKGFLADIIIFDDNIKIWRILKSGREICL
ncbi:MAG: N-acetylglucosamine-6-phosphate deacetylase [Clostridiales bacterium]|nr:N-acetylglucosamine-6-phosphate deacetylase [Clostridiales bacterium]